MPVYATAADLAGGPGRAPWLTTDQLELVSGDEERLLARASEVIADHSGGFSTDADGQPTDTWVADTLRDATCAQVEQWCETGEENDIAGYARSTAVTVGGLNVSSLPSILAPRARRILRSVGLSGGVAW